jgi:hypothetical protein
MDGLARVILTAPAASGRIDAQVVRGRFGEPYLRPECEVRLRQLVPRARSGRSGAAEIAAVGRVPPPAKFGAKPGAWPPHGPTWVHMGGVSPPNKTWHCTWSLIGNRSGIMAAASRRSDELQPPRPSQIKHAAETAYRFVGICTKQIEPSGWRLKNGPAELGE